MILPAHCFWIHRDTGKPCQLETEIEVLLDRPGMVGLETTQGEYAPKYVTLADLERLISAVSVPEKTEP
jgi:hypothetical protein